MTDTQDRIVLLNASVPERENRVNIVVESGRIRGVTNAGEQSFEGDGCVDLGGAMVAPGLVDLRARVTSKEEMKAAAAGGVTHAVLPPDTREHMDDAIDVRDLLQGLPSGVGIHWVGAWTRSTNADALSDMANLQSAGCFSVGCGGRWVPNGLVMRSAMQYATDLGLKLFITPRDPQLAGNGCAHAGRIATRLGLGGIPAAAETAALARDLALVEEIGAPTHFGPLSCAASVNLIRRAQDLGLPVTADTAIHHLFLTDMDLVGFDANCHVDPPLRDQADRDALIQAVRDGVLGVSSDHRPLPHDAKMAPFPDTEPGMANVQLLFALAWRLVEEEILTSAQVFEALSAAPARFIGIDVPRIEAGAPADLTVFDPDEIATAAVAAKDWFSAGRHTAFDGWTFSGAVRGTMVGGRWIFGGPGTQASGRHR